MNSTIDSNQNHYKQKPARESSKDIASKLSAKILSLTKMPVTQTASPAQIKRFFETLLCAARSTQDENLIEVRILNEGAGLFDDPDIAASICEQFSGKRAIYFGLNPRRIGSLKDRPRNKLFKFNRGEGFSQNDVESYLWLPIDIDPAREPKTEASSYAEIEDSTAIFEAIYCYLQKKGIPSLVGLSGNGIHLLIRLAPAEVSDQTKKKIGYILNYLNRKFGTELVKVDGANKDPARIFKAYGTLAIKGGNTSERPHRMAHLLYPQQSLRCVDLDKEFKDEIEEQQAFEIPRPRTTLSRPLNKSGPAQGDYSTLDIVALFERLGLYCSHIEGAKHEVQCPWESDHSSSSRGDTIIFEASNGAWPNFFCHHDHCRDRKIEDVFGYVGNEVVDSHCARRFTPSTTADQSYKDRPFITVKGTPVSWEPMRDLPRALPIAPRLTQELANQMIPEPIRPWILDIADRLQVPIESVAACAFACLSGIIGRKVCIFPKRNDDWQVLCVLWMALVARPSQKKTPTMSEVMKPLAMLESAAREEFKDQQADGKAAQAVRKAKIDAIKDNMKSAAKSKGPKSAIEMDIAQRELANLEKDDAEQLVFERRFKTCDATVEKLGELLNQNPNGLIYKRDELCGWLRSFDRPGREGDREFFLEAWNGKDSFNVDRIGRGSLHVKALCLTVIGGIQPGKLESYVAEASKGSSGDDGLLQRFQLLIYPERAVEEPIYIDRKPNIDARATANQIFKMIHELNPLDIGATSAGDDIPGLRFNSEAQRLFESWLITLERRLHSTQDISPSYEAHLGKYRSLMPALALQFHLIERLTGTNAANDINLECARRAAMWCEFLEAHAQKVYAISIDKENHGAHALAKKIKDGKVFDGMKVRDLKRHHWSLLADGDSVDAAIMVLEEYRWARVERVQTEGAPIPVIKLHPNLVPVPNEGV